MARPDLDERFRRSKLHRFLLADEHVIVAQRQHWASFWKPIAFGAGGLVVLVVLALWLPASLDGLNPFLLLAWFVVIGGWTLWRYLMWRRNWLVATDKRVMVNYGLLHQGVAMFSLSRVPDLTYTRSSIGQLLGYGELKRESTAINQTLHKVRFVEHPHATYTTICAAIFELQDRMFRINEDQDYGPANGGPAPRHPGPPPRTPGLVTAPGAPRGPIDAEVEPAQGEDPPGIRIHYGVSRHHDRDPWRQSADLRASSLRDADTGPVPYRPSSTDESDEWLPPTTDKRQPHPQTPDDEQDR
jgi:hypothetical protein